MQQRKELVRSWGQFDVYAVYLPLKGINANRPRYYLLFNNTFVDAWSEDPSFAEIHQSIEKWIERTSVTVDRQENVLEPLIDERQSLIDRASETCIFQIPDDSTDKFTIDPFWFRLISPGKYRVYILDEYIDWEYFSSSDISETFEPAHETDTEGFRRFLRNAVQALEQDKPRRKQQRIEKRRRISEIEDAFASLRGI